jgi:hypothetical protein
MKAKFFLFFRRNNARVFNSDFVKNNSITITTHPRNFQKETDLKYTF